MPIDREVVDRDHRRAAGRCQRKNSSGSEEGVKPAPPELRRPDQVATEEPRPGNVVVNDVAGFARRRAGRRRQENREAVLRPLDAQGPDELACVGSDAGVRPSQAGSVDREL